MAQDAELKLKVSLDLAFFRQQISTIGTQLAGQGIDISAKIDEDDVEKQYKSLAKTLESKTIKLKVESATLDSLVIKAANLKKNLEEFSKQDIFLNVKIADNIAELRKDIKSKLPSVAIDTHLNEPVKVDDFIGDVAKKVKDQVERSYVAGGIPIATKLSLPGVTDPLNALQKSLNRQDPLKAKVGTKPSIFKADVTAFQAAVNEKFKNITVKIKAELDTASATAPQSPAAASSRTFLQELKGLDKNTLQSVYRAASEDALLAFDEGIINNKASMIQALRDAARDASDGFLSALENKKSALFKAAGEYAGALLGGLKKELKIQSPSREMFDIGDDAGKGFELGLLKAMQLAEKSATNQMRRILDRLARMALMMGGMSAEQINRQVAQARALPGLDFPATVPPRQRIPIGPSETGRALPAGRAAAGLIGAAQAPAGLLPSVTRQSGLTMGLEALVQALVSQSRGRGPEGPGAIVSMETGFIPAMRERFAKAAERYLFGVETQVVDLFDAALRQVESAVDLHIARIQGQISQRMRSAVSVVDLGVQGRPMLPGAITGRAPLMLPPAGGTTPIDQMRFNAVRTGGVIPPSPLMLPPAGGTTPQSQMRFNAVRTGGFPLDGMHIPSTELSKNYLAQRELINGLRGADKFLSQSKVPLSGAIRGLGQEFGFALQQVLLFGTAYKALAFITDLPSQALSASKALQTFENQLNAITGSAANADRAFGFVDNIANRFNVPLDSARQGFVRLYASMAPAGFSADQIENLFTGITKASATLGLSADKVDRVTYAFSQMASKGQLMSEEVSGQLGDVIPGALSIMAEAARMDIATFKQAMEDGAFVGKAFEQVMSNVPIVLENKFGKGAAGAANTLQGAMNALTTSTVKFYESFEPIIQLGAVNIFPVLSKTLEQATSAVKAFGSAMQGNQGPANMLSGSARNIYDILLQLKEIFGALAVTIKNLAPTFATLGQSVLQVLTQISRFVSTPLGSFIANVIVQAALLTSGLQLLAKLGFGRAIAGLINLVFNTKAAIYQMKELTRTSALAKFALISLGASIVITSIFSVVTALNAVYERMIDIQRGAKNAAQAIASMSQTEATVKARSIEGQIALLQRFYGQAKKFGGLPVEASAAEVTAMAAAGGTPGQAFTGALVDEKTGAYGRGTITPTMVPAAIQALESQLAAARKQAEPVVVQSAELGAVDIEAGKDKNEKKKKLVSEMAKIYKQELDNYLVYIDMDTNISDREKELQKAAISWQYEHAIAKEEYNEKIKEQNTKDIANLTEYLAEQKRLFKLEQDQIDARYQAVVTKPLREMLGEDRKAQIQLQASIASLASGKEEMTRVEQRESEIKQALLGLNDKQKEALTPLIKLVLSEAKAVDELTAKQKEQNDAIRERQELQKRVKDTLSNLRDEIDLLRSVTEEEQKRLKIAKEFKGASSDELNRIYDLEKVRDNIKAVRETIDSFVTDTSSDYKGFLKEIISGEDAVDSLKKFQEALKDRTLTIFLDFAMAPVEKFFKEMAAGNFLKMFFPETAAEQAPEEKLVAPVEANTSAIIDNTSAIRSLTSVIGGTAPTATGMSVGNDLANQLTQERGYEDVAGLQPLPLQKMLQQIGRPLTVLYQTIERARKGLYPYSKQEVNKMLAPNPARTQTILQRAQAVERARQADPLEAQWKERENRWRTEKRSSPASASLSTFEGVVRQLSQDAFKQLNQMGGMYGILDDLSDYLNEGQLEVLRKGVQEQLRQGVRPSRMPIGGNINTGRATVEGAIQSITQEVLEEMRLETTRDIDGINMDKLMQFNEPPRIQPGVESQFEGAMLPGAAFDISKMDRSYGEIATASESLSGLLDNMSTYTAGIQQNTEKVNSSLVGLNQSVYSTAQEAGPEGSTGQKFIQSLGGIVQGIGIAAGSIMGITAGIQQVKEGGASNILGGIGMIASAAGSLLGGFSGLFGGSAGPSSIVQGKDIPIAQMPAGMQFANGGVAFGGFRAFANGGTVSGPTLGLIGEGKYNEAVVPLPNGKSIPVQFSGERSARDMMSRNAQAAAQASPISLSFETTKIGNTEYVSRDQLEAAMAETRRAAINGGAARGMSMTLDRIQQSPSVRSRIGIR